MALKRLKIWYKSNRYYINNRIWFNYEKRITKELCSHWIYSIYILNGERNPINSKPNKTNRKKCQHKFWCHISFKRRSKHLCGTHDFILGHKWFRYQFEKKHGLACEIRTFSYIHVSFQLNTILCIHFLRILSFFIYIACLRTFLSKKEFL